MSGLWFDLEFYHLYRPELREWFGRNPIVETELPRALADFAATRGCHILAVYRFYGEAFGSTETLEENFQRLMRFYKFEGLKVAA